MIIFEPPPDNKYCYKPARKMFGNTDQKNVQTNHNGQRSSNKKRLPRKKQPFDLSL